MITELQSDIFPPLNIKTGDIELRSPFSHQKKSELPKLNKEV
jgi:hypothetical protein